MKGGGYELRLGVILKVEDDPNTFALSPRICELKLGAHESHDADAVGLWRNVKQVTTDGGPLHNSHGFRRMAKRLGCSITMIITKTKLDYLHRNHSGGRKICCTIILSCEYSPLFNGTPLTASHKRMGKMTLKKWRSKSL